MRTVEMGGGGATTRSCRGRVTTHVAAVVLILAAAAAFFRLSPPQASGAGDLILERAAGILGVSPPGEGARIFPSSSAWSGYLMAGVQEGLFRLSGGGNRALFVQSHHGLWMGILRAIWALLSSLVTAGGVRLALAATPPGRPGRMAGAAIAGASLLCSPVLPIGIRELAVFVPAGAVALWTAGSVLRGRDGALQTGVALGLVLAWFPFLWPLVPVAIAVHGVRGVSLSRLSGVLGLAVFLGLVLEPRHLVDLGRLPALWSGEWRRGGGWGGPGGADILPQLTLWRLLGPAAFVVWLSGWSVFRRAWRDAPALLTAGVWAGLVLLPATGGVRSPGSAQYAAAAVLAAWTGIAVASLPKTRAGAWLPWVLGLSVVGLMIPGRVGMERAARESASIRESVVSDLSSFIGPDDLWISDSILLPGGASGKQHAFSRLGFVLPRDSSQPGRYDYAYWPRWYAGFRWVLLSSARVRENIARSGADGPAAFYGSLSTSADLVRTWGSGEREGYRLYRIREGSRWTHPLTGEEMAGMRGRGGRMTWFIGNLGALYMEAGDPGAAATLFRKGMEWDPGSVSLYNNLGAAYLREGEFELAASVFEEGLRIAPGSFELLYNFALACVGQGLHDRAERLLRRVLAERPGYAPAHFELAGIFQMSSRDALAREALRRFLELDPDSPRREDAERRLRILDAGGGRGVEGGGDGSGPGQGRGDGRRAGAGS